MAVITGAGGGLAPAVVTAFARAGHRLALVTRHGKENAPNRATEALADVARADARTYGADLADAADTVKTFARIAAELGPVDVLLNLAGGFAAGPAADTAPEAFEHQLDINLRTAVNATRAVLPSMLERGSGFVAAMGANAVLAPASGSSAYAAAKGAVATYFRALAAEVGKHGVTAALLIPTTAIDTPGNRAAMPKADPANWIAPEALASALLFMASREARGKVHELVVQPH